MSDPQETRRLPDRPNLRHLKDQAKDLLASRAATSLADAQFKIARLYGFSSWPKLKAHVDSVERKGRIEQAYRTNDVESLVALLEDWTKELMATGQAESAAAAHALIAASHGLAGWDQVHAEIQAMKARDDSALSSEITRLGRAIDTDDLKSVQALMTAAPALHQAPMGYGRSGPLTCAAECRVPPSAGRLAIVQWMIDNGSDVHQGGDAPLMRAALGNRIPMMELLVRNAADVNALWNGNYPIIFAACEEVDPVAIAWLLQHGANPNAGSPDGRFADTALDYVIGSYVRSPALGQCIDILLKAGGTTQYDPVVVDLLLGGTGRIADRLNGDAALVTRRLPDLDFGTTGGRMLTLAGATLLHVASEYGRVDAAQLLLDRGADVNARASVDADGVGGQSPIFHAATQFENRGLPTLKLLLDNGADLSVRARVPGHYERPGEVIECTPLGYAIRFQDETRRGDKSRTVALLRAHGGAE